MGIIQNNNQKIYQTKAQTHVRQQWESLEAMNPHRAAHYGLYAFKPLNLLNSIDGGINDYTGNVLKLEGHVQNEIAYSESVVMVVDEGESTLLVNIAVVDSDDESNNLINEFAIIRITNLF